MSKFKLVAKYGLILVIGAVIARGISFIHRWWGMYALDLEQYADFALMASLYFAVIPIAGFGLTSSLARFLASSDKNMGSDNEIYLASVTIGFFAALIGGLLFILLFPDLANNYSATSIVIAVFIGLFGSALMQINMGFALGKKLFIRLAAWEVGEAISKFIILLFLLIVGINLSWLSFFWSLILAAPVIVMILGFNKLKVIALSLRSDYSAIRIVQIIRKLTPHAVSVVIISFSVLILAYFLRLFAKDGGIQEVSYLDAAFVFYGIPRLVFAALVRPVIPMSASDDERNGLALNWWAALLVILVPIPIGIFIAFTEMGDLIFSVMSLSNYNVSAIALGILVCGSGVDLLFGYISSRLQGINKANNLAWICVVCLLPFLIYILILSNHGNAQIAAIIFVSYYCVLTISSGVYLKMITGNKTL